MALTIDQITAVAWEAYHEEMHRRLSEYQAQQSMERRQNIMAYHDFMREQVLSALKTQRVLDKDLWVDEGL